MPSLSEDRDAIRDLFARYIAVTDNGPVPPEAWASFYTEDGEFHQHGRAPIVGREALLTFAGTLPTGGVRHLITDHVIDVDGDHGTCEATVALVVKGQWFGTGRASDVLRRVDGSWRIARRSFIPDA